jgi:uncharacterized protein (TIGR00304 family)
MNKYIVLSILCFIVGIILIGLGVSTGQGKVYLLIFIPVIEGTGIFSILGILLIIAGIFLFMFGYIGDSFELISEEEYVAMFNRPSQSPHPIGGKPPSPPGRPQSQQREHFPGQEQTQPQKPKARIRSGGVIFIGPIPIIWGSDRKTAYIMALVSVVMVFIFLIFILTWLI